MNGCVYSIDSKDPFIQLIKNKLGNNTKLAVEFISILNDDAAFNSKYNFAEIEDDNTKYEILKNYYYYLKPDGNNSVTEDYKGLVNKGSFDNVSIRRHAVGKTVDLLSTVYRNSIMQVDEKTGKQKNKNATRNDYINDTISHIYNQALAFAKANDSIYNRAKEIRKESSIIDKRKLKYFSISQALLESENATDRYWGALLDEVAFNTQKFFDEVSNDTRLQFLNKELSEESIVEVEEEELEAEEGEDISFEFEGGVTIDELDNSIADLDSHGGFYDNAMKHVDSFVRAYLNSLKKLKSSVKDGIGEFIEDTDNISGTADTMNAEECIDMLYHKTNILSPDNFVESIKVIARQQAGFEAFATLADDLEKHPDLKYYFCTVFRKNLVTKNIITYEDGQFVSTISNQNTDRRTAFRNELLNSTRHTSLNLVEINFLTKLNNVEKIFRNRGNYKGFDSYLKLLENIKTEERELKDLTEGTQEYNDKLEKIAGIKNSVNKYQDTIVEGIYDIVHAYFPTINRPTITGFLYNTEGNKTFEDNVKELLPILREVIDGAKITNNDKYAIDREISILNAKLWQARNPENTAFEIESGNENVKIYTVDEINAMNSKIKSLRHTDFVSNKLKTAAVLLSDKFIDYSTVSSELNSPNVHGNLSSDVMNSNYMTYWMNMLTSQASEINENGINEKGILRNFGKYRFRGHQYDFSNIMFERKIGNTTMPGLFKKYEDGTVVPTTYAGDLLKFELFNGASNEESGDAATYTEISHNDYIFSAFINFFNPDINLNRHNDVPGSLANYFVRTQSDAPKTFLIKAPMYSIGAFGEKGSLLAIANKEELRNLDAEIIGRIKSETVEKPNKKKSKEVSVEQAAVHMTNDNPQDIFIGDEKSTSFPFVNKTPVGQEGVIKLSYTDSNGNTFIYYMRGTHDNRNNSGKHFLTNVKLDHVENIGKMPNSLRKQIYNIHERQFIRDNKVKYKIEHTHPIFEAFRNSIKQEITDAASQIVKLFEMNSDGTVVFEDGKPKLRAEYQGKGISRTYDLFHHNSARYEEITGKKGDGIIALNKKTGKWELTGNVFRSDRFRLYKDVDTRTAIIKDYGSELMADMFDFFYGGDANRLRIKIHKEGNRDVFDGVEFIDDQENAINEKLEQFIRDYIADTNRRLAPIEGMFTNYLKSAKNYAEFALNYHLMYINMNELLEGDSKFYKDGQDFLKRAKEGQAGGVPYGIADFEEDLTQNAKQLPSNLDNANVTVKYHDKDGKVVNSAPIHLSSRFKAITIKNTIRRSEDSQALVDVLVNKKLMTREGAENFMKYYGRTKTNDAQSYITFAEWIRRVTAMGQYNKYKYIIDKISKGEKLNNEEVDEFVQVQKNFYYDQHYNSEFDIVVPRQIKNAEFVLIPQFIEGTELEKVYDFMMQYGIDQLNTQETSKAGKANVFTIWDNEGFISDWDGFIDEFTRATNAVEEFSYNFLYRQQETPQHVDANNKAGIQIMKKIIDNLPSFDDVARLEDEGKVDEKTLREARKLAQIKDEFFRLYTSNIKGSFTRFGRLLQMDFDKDGNLRIDENGNIKFDKELLYKKLRTEARRLGLNSNELEYMTLEDGETIMPSYFTIFSNKLENIVQSMINRNVTRQTLKGFHAAQVTGIGIASKWKGKEGQIKTASEWKGKRLRYHPDGKPYIEVVIPRPAILDGFTDEEIFEVGADGKNMLEREGLDILIGYRIPTEGKQSLAIMKVVGFVDKVQGSTIIVPDDWVAQTGADFDIDSIYAIQFETYTDKDKKVHKIKYNQGVTDFDYLNRYSAYISEAINDYKRVYDDTEDSNSEKPRKAARKAVIDSINNIGLEEKSQIESLLRGDSKDSTESRLYEDMSSENKNNKITVDNILQNKNMTYFDRVNKVINTFADDVKKNPHSALAKFVSFYQELSDAMSPFEHNRQQLSEFFSEEQKKKRFEIEVGYLEKVAEKLGVKSFEQFKELSIEEQNTKEARNNRLLDDMIDIASSDNVLEEILSQSNFRDIIEARDEMMSAKAKKARKARSPYNFLDQAEYQEEVISGKTLKAFSVSRDTFCSICNTVKPTMAANLISLYDSDKVSLEELNKSFDNVEEYNIEGKKYYKVTHNRIGWSKNNKGVSNKHITIYTSETTAHHLDAVKEGGIPNVNELTFGVYKTIPDVGMDYRTAVSFIMQPGITRIINAYDRSRSIFNKDYNRVYIDTAIKTLAMNMKLKVGDNIITDMYVSIDRVLNAFNEEYGDYIKQNILPYMGMTDSEINNFNIGYSMYDISKLAFNTNLYKDRLNNEGIFSSKNTSGSEYITNRNLFDLITMLQYYRMSDIAEKITNYAQVTSPDKFGAKQTIFATQKIFDDINTLLNSSDGDFLFVTDGEGNKINMLESIYPGIKYNGGVDITHYVQSNENNSSYPSLHYFLKYASGTSILLGRQLFATQKDAFREGIYRIANELGVSINEKLYNDFKQYVFGHLMTVGPNRPSDAYLQQIMGVGQPLTVNFEPENISNPTEDEKKMFNSMTPAQQVFWIQQHFSDGLIFNYLRANVFTSYKNRLKLAPQRITFNYDSTNIEVAFDEFRKAYYNDNFYLQIAAESLAAYALIVENFKMRRNGISKIVPNDVIRDMGITDMIDINREEMMEYLFNSDIESYNVYTDYVRSHKDKVKRYRIPKGEDNKDLFKIPTDNGVLSVLSLGNVSDVESLGFRAGLVDEQGRFENYLRFLWGKDKNKHDVIMKAKLDERTGFLYYYPLNELNENEHTMFSADQTNNKYFTEDAYINKVNDLSIGINEQITKTEANFYDRKHQPFIEDVFDINNPIDQNVEYGFKDVVNKITEHFKTGAENALFFRSSALAGKGSSNKRYISSKGHGSVQRINGRQYLILAVNPRRPGDIIKRETKGRNFDYYYKHEDKLDGLNESFANIIHKLANSENHLGQDEVFMAVPVRNVVKHSTVSEYANETLVTIEADRGRGSYRAANTLTGLKAFNIDRKNEDSVERNLKRTTGAIRRYVVGTSESFLRRINDFFETHDDSAVSINSKEVMDRIKKDDNFRNDFLKFILDVDTFVGNYKNIYELNVKSDNVDIEYNINKIKEAIAKLENNTDISRAREEFAKQYLKSISTDPLIRADMYELTDGYNNVSGLESWVSDALEAGIPIMQVILKDVMADVEGKTMEGEKAARDFISEMKKIERDAISAGRKINYDNIIDATGHFVKSYTPALVKERDEKLKKLDEIRNDDSKGRLSIEYIKARHDYNVWKANHFELPYVHDYYVRKYDNEAKILESYPEYYAQYVQLDDQRHAIYMNADDGNLSAEDQAEYDSLTAKINAMRSETVDEDGFVFKTGEELDKVNALNEFFNEEKKIHSEFFEPATTKGMQEKINDNLRIMRTYEARDANGIQTRSDGELAKIPEYVKASRWIRLNATLEFTDKELENRIRSAYANLRVDTDETTAKRTNKYGSIIRLAKARDMYGIVDGTKFTDKQIDKIKEDQEAKLKLSNPNRLLSYAVDDGIIYKDSFYYGMKRGATAKTETPKWTKTVKQINAILQTCYNPNTRTLHTSDLTIKQLDDLAELYDILEDKNTKHYARSSTTAKEIKEYIEDNVVFKTNFEIYNAEEVLAANKGGKYLNAWRKANRLRVYDAETEAEVYLPNKYLYSYAKPKGKLKVIRDSEGNIIDITGDKDALKHVDIAKTKAIDTVRNNVRSVRTEYYDRILAEKQKLPREEYRKWYERNHIYNPNTRTVEPIKCWLRPEYVNSSLEAGKIGSSDSKYEWVPNSRQVTKYIKKEYQNPNYKSGGDLNNYKKGTGFDNPIAENLSDNEILMRDAMQSVLSKYLGDNSGAGYRGRKLLDSGVVPTVANQNRNAKWWYNQFGATIGFIDTREQKDFFDEIDYSEDKPVDIPMMQKLINKSSRKLEYIKSRDQFPPTDEGLKQYKEHIKEVKETNEKIKAENDKIHSEIMNRNWEEVFRQFIPRIARYDAIQQNKYMLYYGLNTLRRMKAYDSPLGINIIHNKSTVDMQGAPISPLGYRRDYKRSTNENTRYKTVDYDNAVELYKTYIRRLLFGQHKKNNGFLTKAGNTLQNMASAKYMMANITGGIVNVTYGEGQVLQEVIAKEFINANAWKEGRKLYTQGISSYFSDMFKDESTTLQSALIKLFNVIDTDNIVGLAETGVSGAVKKGRDLLYGLQSGGEHLMQNTVLLAMLKEHKIFKDSTGKLVIQNLEQFQRASDEMALNYIIETSHPELKAAYDAFIKEIKSNPNKRKDYITRHRFVITDFFELLDNKNKKAIAEEYIAKRKEFEKSREAEWNGEKDLYSQFVLEKGFAEIKEDSILKTVDAKDAWKTIGAFRNKVVYVNKKIHGVYDQMGAARLEQEWYGSLVMQYHKHIYPGLMKRYRWQGYYNETREGVEKGSFASLIDFLRIPMANAAKQLNMTNEEYKAMSGIQRMFKIITDGCVNYQLHWKLLPASERANFRRNFADWIVFISAVAAACAARMIWRKEKDRDSLTYNTIAYVADKTGMDAQMYTAWGLVSETKTIWKNPIAAQSGIEDVINSMGIICSYLIGRDENTIYKSGIYKGESKLKVWALRQIPVYRGVNRWLNLPKNNRAYALQTNPGRELANYFASFSDGTVESYKY